MNEPATQTQTSDGTQNTDTNTSTNTNTTTSDGTQNTAQTQTQNTDEFTPAQQAIFDRAMGRTRQQARQQGEDAILQRLGISRDDLDSVTIQRNQQSSNGSSQQTQSNQSQSSQSNQNQSSQTQSDDARQAQARADALARQVEQSNAEMARMRGIMEDKEIRGTVLTEISRYNLVDGIVAEDIFSLVRNQFKVDEQGNTIVIDGEGNRAINGQTGEFMTPRTAITEFFKSRQGFLKPAQSGVGAGSVNGQPRSSAYRTDWETMTETQLAEALSNPETLKALEGLAQSRTDVNPFKQAQINRRQSNG